MSTNITEFRKFLGLIPDAIKEKMYFVPLRRQGKEPDVAAGESWKDPSYKLSIQDAEARLRQKSNVGFVAQKETMIVIDQDNMEKFTNPKPTLSVITSSGKRHYYYINDGTVENRDLKDGKEHILEIRADWRYVVAPGSHVPPDPKTALSEGTGLYRIAENIQPTILTLKDLPPELQPQEKTQITLGIGGTYRNRHGWSIQEIRLRDDKINRLLNNENEEYPSASEADMATIAKLKWWDYDNGEAAEILKTFRPREKLNRENYVITILEKIGEMATISDVVDVDLWKPDGGYGKIEDFFKISEEKTQELEQIRPETIEQLHQMNHKWLEITDRDKEYIEVMYAAAIDRTMVGDPVWLYAIAPSGGMKTTIARSLQKYARVYSLDKITPATLVSGLSKKDKETGDPIPAAGLLQYLDGKTLVIKDFTTMLSMPNDMRNEIYGQLRSVYDGYYEAAFGSLPQPIRVKADIGLILCVTPVIDKYTQAHTSLGERLLKIRQHPDPIKTTAKSIQNMGKEPEMRFELQNAVAFYLNTLDTENIPEIKTEYIYDIAKIARLTALCRSHVYCDYYKGQIVTIEPTEAEIPTRLVKQLRKLAMLLAIIRKKTEVTIDEMKTIIRVAFDTCHQDRIDIIKAIYENKDPLTSGALATRTKLHPQTCYNSLRQMCMLDLVYEKNVENKTCYFLSENTYELYSYITKTYSTNSSNGITDLINSVVVVTPPTMPLLLVEEKPNLKEQMNELYSLFVKYKQITEHDLVEKHLYGRGEVKNLLGLLARDNLIYNLRPGVWGVV